GLNGSHVGHGITGQADQRACPDDSLPHARSPARSPTSRGPLERDDDSSNRHLALTYSWSMIFSENRYPLFGIMLYSLPRLDRRVFCGCFIPERKSKFIKSLRNQLSPAVISRMIDRPYDPSFFVSYDPSFFLNYLHFVVSFLQLIIGCGILVELH